MKSGTIHHLTTKPEEMNNSILLVSLLLNFYAFAQTGGIYVHCEGANDNPIKVIINIRKDSTLITSLATNAFGDCIIRNLPVGQLTLDLISDGQPSRFYELSLGSEF